MTDELTLSINIIPKMDAVDAALKKIEKKPIIGKLPGQEGIPSRGKDPFTAFKKEETRVGKVHLDPIGGKKNTFDALKNWGRVFKIDLFWKWIKGTWGVLLKYVPLLKSLSDILSTALSLILTALLLPFLPQILGVLTYILRLSAGFFKWAQANGDEIKATLSNILSGLVKGIIVKYPAIAAKVAATTGTGGIGKVLTVFKDKIYKFLGTLKNLIPKEFKEAFNIVMKELDAFAKWIKAGADKLLKPLGNAIDDIAGVLKNKAAKLLTPITELINTRFGGIIAKLIGDQGLSGLSSVLGKVLAGALSLANVALWGSLVGDIFAVIGQLGQWIFTDLLDIPILAVFFNTIEKGGKFFSEFLNIFDWVIAALKDFYGILTGGPVGALQKKFDDVGKSLVEFGESIIAPGKESKARALTAMALGKDTREVTEEEVAEWKKTHPGVKLAAGGIVTQPTNALIGEAGPEAVIPLDKMGSMGGTTITVNGLVDEYKFRSIIREEIDKSNRRLFNARGAVSI